MISIVFCWRGVKHCAYATRDFRSHQNGAVTRMWWSCRVQPSHKERAIGAVHCKKEGMLLQPLRWCCVDCVIHHERDVREEQHHTYTSREQAIIEWSRWSYLCEWPLIMLVNLVNSWWCLLTITTSVREERLWHGSSADINVWTIEHDD